jgi:LacI family transcriptional regulator
MAKLTRGRRPPLTTVRLGMRAMALALGPPTAEPRVEHLPAELIRRASTGPPPSAVS